MKLTDLTMWLAGSALFASSAAFARTEHCSTVSGRYGIYANGDRLHVHGSRHLLVVVINALDERLGKAGWETADAFGKFTICYGKALTPLELTNRDAVRVRSYSNIRIVKHR
jgi:hypothetical protein